MYRGLDLTRDTYKGFPLRPVRARRVVQPVAECNVRSFTDDLEAQEDALEYHWSDGQARVSSLVASARVKRVR